MLGRAGRPGRLATPDPNKATTVWHGAPQLAQAPAEPFAPPPAPFAAPPAPEPPAFVAAHEEPAMSPAFEPPGIPPDPGQPPEMAPPAPGAPPPRPARTPAEKRGLLILGIAGAALLLVLGIVLGRGCGKGKGAGAGGSAAAGGAAAGPGIDALTDAWKSAGLQPGGFAPVSGERLGGGTCQSGAVSGLEVTVCTYATPDAAAQAHKAGLAMVGEVTGSAIVSGNRMIVLADRKGADPSGKTINKILRVFQGKPAEAPPPPKSGTEQKGK
jgi:hypothetical protein